MTHHNYPLLIDLRRDIFLGHEIHPIIYGTDKGQVGHPVVGYERGWGHASLNILNGLPALVLSFGRHPEPLIDLLHSLSDEIAVLTICLLYTSDAADERSSVDLGGRR